MTEKQENLARYATIAAAIVILAYTVIKIATMSGNITIFSIKNNGFNEVRDYVSFRLTNLIMEGKNPYTFEMLNELNVPFMCLYTVLNPSVVAVVCKITGMSIMAGYYFVNILYVLFTIFNIWLIVRDFFSNSKWIALICVAINSATFFSLFGLPIFNFHTDSVGIYITSIMLLIVYKDKKLTLPLAILSVSLIFTKQILIVMAAPLFVYYLIKDKKLALKFFVECVICGIITLGIVQLCFPLYWTETIYAQFFISKDYGSVYSSILNIIGFYYRYFPYLILIFGGTIAAIVIRSKSGYKFSLYSFINELVAEEEYAIYLILNVVFGTFFLLYFAKCGGDGYKYCQDILAPSWFVLFIYVWNFYFERHLIVNEKKVQIKKSCILIAVCLASVVTYSNFQTIAFSQEDEETFRELNDVISAHEGETIYLGMDTTQYLLNENSWEPENVYFNDGQIEYFNNYYLENSVINNFFYDEEIKTAATEYVGRVNELIANKEFGLVATCIDMIVDSEILEQNYCVYNTYNVKTDTNGCFEVTVWLPIE